MMSYYQENTYQKMTLSCLLIPIKRDYVKMIGSKQCWWGCGGKEPSFRVNENIV